MANIDRINKKLDKKNSNTVAYYAAMAKNNNFFYNVIRYFINRKNRHPVKTTIITYSNDCSLFTPIKSFFNVGIVFQGPVMHDCNFTVDSIKIARSLYPEVKIILSTWKNELTDLERVELKKFRCIILESDSLSAEHKGTGEKLGHMNNQILSSFVGIEYLKKMRVEYVMKIRSDIRIYKHDFIPYLLNLMKAFPLGSANTTLHSRLVNVAFSNSLINIPFHMSDFVWFGQIDDMELMYSVQYRSKEDLEYLVSKTGDKTFFSSYEKKFEKALKDSDYGTKSKICPFNTDDKFLILYHEEVYLAYNFFKLIMGVEGSMGKSLYEQYYEFLKNDIIIIDDDDICCYWNKSFYSHIKSDYEIKLSRRLTHSRWLQYYLSEY